MTSKFRKSIPDGRGASAGTTDRLFQKTDVSEHENDNRVSEYNYLQASRAVGFWNGAAGGNSCRRPFEFIRSKTGTGARLRKLQLLPTPTARSYCRGLLAGKKSTARWQAKA
jgi:hypothetical protein